MQEIQASEAKTHLPRLLDEVERGHTLIITRHGRRIARLIPEPDRRRTEVERAVAEILTLPSRKANVSVEDILSARDEGRR